MAAFRCPCCRRRIRLAEHQFGRTLTCSKCGGRFSADPAILSRVDPADDRGTTEIRAEPATDAKPTHFTVDLVRIEQPRPAAPPATRAPRVEAQSGPWEIRVSARIITWPGGCSCCGAPTDAEWKATCTRVTGIRVIHSETRAWRVPCCARCADHAQCFEMAVAAAVKLEDLREPRDDRNIALALAFVLTVPLLAAGISGGIEALGCVILPLLAGWLVTWAVMESTGMGLRAHRREQDELTAERDLAEDRAFSLKRSGCTAAGAPVVYLDWDGSVHRFEFHSLAYAEAFAAANGGKLLGAIRVSH